VLARAAHFLLISPRHSERISGVWESYSNRRTAQRFHLKGEYYSFGVLTVDPCALQPHMPIWIGGRAKRSLRRAVTLADGWCPFNVSIATAAEWLQAWELRAGFEVV
jgi:hypothetical protein